MIMMPDCGLQYAHLDIKKPVAASSRPTHESSETATTPRTGCPAGRLPMLADSASDLWEALGMGTWARDRLTTGWEKGAWNHTTDGLDRSMRDTLPALSLTATALELGSYAL